MTQPEPNEVFRWFIWLIINRVNYIQQLIRKSRKCYNNNIQNIKNKNTANKRIEIWNYICHYARTEVTGFNGLDITKNPPVTSLLKIERSSSSKCQLSKKAEENIPMTTSANWTLTLGDPLPFVANSACVVCLTMGDVVTMTGTVPSIGDVDCGVVSIGSTFV